MINTEEIQKAILEETLEGWLFYMFRRRDPVACRLLEIPESAKITRPCVYFIPAPGSPVKQPVKIVHSIEPDSLANLPGTVINYISGREMAGHLANLAEKCSSGKPAIAVQISETIPAISHLDYGSAQLLIRAGFKLVSSAPLIQRTFGLLDDSALICHKRTFAVLTAIVRSAWQEISAAFADSRDIYEGDVQKLMLDMINDSGLCTDHAPVAAAGKNTASPHYCPEGKGKKICRGELFQFDIWAREKYTESVFADISWIAYTADDISAVPREITAMFTDLVSVRDRIVDYINSSFAGGIRPTGAETDIKARELLTGLGYGGFLKHRTGHSIDRDVHGSGVNLDSLEFPDERKLLDGACFSVEPGIYRPEYGMRTEIDVYIKDRTAAVSGPDIQHELLLLNKA